MVWLASPTTVRSSRLAEPGVEHPLLQRRDVLVLVDDEAAVAVAELLGDRGVVLDRGGGVQQQVVEVEQRHAVAAGLERLVAGVDRRDLGRVERDVAADLGDRGRVALGADQRGLGPFDFAGEVADVVGAGRQARAVGGLRHDRELAVEQLPSGVADHAGPEVRQLAAGGGVERHRLHRSRYPTAIIERTQPAAHLPCGALA